MYILEGIIGAGKSTFLKLLSQQFHHIMVKLEPVDKWQAQEFGQSLLTNFYSEPQRWAFSLETFALFCRVKEHTAYEHEKTPLIMERSIYSGHYVFAHNSYKNGFMTPLEWHIYNQWFSMLTQQCKAPQGIIYLQVDPEIAYARIKKRQRSAEDTLPFNYLQQIHEHHEQFLINQKDNPHLASTPILVLNCNDEFETNNTQFNQFGSKINQFILDTYK